MLSLLSTYIVSNFVGTLGATAAPKNFYWDMSLTSFHDVPFFYWKRVKVTILCTLQYKKTGGKKGKCKCWQSGELRVASEEWSAGRGVAHFMILGSELKQWILLPLLLTKLVTVHLFLPSLVALRTIFEAMFWIVRGMLFQNFVCYDSVIAPGLPAKKMTSI